MKRNNLKNLIWVILLGGILFSSFYHVYAQPKDNIDTQLAVAISTPTKTISSGGTIYISPTPSPKPDDKERILKVLKNLVNLANSNYLHAGWLYCSSESQLFTTDQKTLPDGSPLPLKSNHHSWYRLDDTGKVLQAITFEDTGDSLSSQMSVYQNGMWKNITLGLSMAEENYILKLDSGIVESVQDLGETDTVSMEFTSLNGANVVKIEKRYYYPKPTQFVVNDTRKYIGDAITQYLDQETGVTAQTDQSHIKLDGTLEVTNRLFNQKCEKQPNALSVYFNPPE